MTFEEICQLISEDCGLEKPLHLSQDGLMPFVEIDHTQISKLCDFLYKNEKTYFDYLACITGLDLGSEKNTFEVVYNLYSIPYEHSFCIKISIKKSENKEPSFQVPTVSHIWRSANWHEREIFDLFGISFKNHPDLRRILLPADWKGFPLRKDYKTDEYYHHLKIDY